MEVKIGLAQLPKELIIDACESAEEISAALHHALNSPDGLLTLTDEKGRHIMVVASRIGYVELGQEHTRPVGFGAVGGK